MSKGASKILLTIPILLILAVGLYFSHTFVYDKGVEDGRELAFAEFESQKPDKPDLRALAQNTELASDGQKLFTNNCARCHGDNGEGDGPEAAGLNPPPRNYKTESFKFGDDIVSIFTTLRQGSPGTSMPGFSLLPAKDLFAMAHYVRTLVPEPTPTTDDILARLPSDLSGPGAVSQGPRIPILFAMERMAVPQVELAVAKPTDTRHPGAMVYARNCALCHGKNGEGMSLDWISVDPYVYESTRSLANRDAFWYDNRDEFARLVAVGLPGRVMPGNAELTKQEISDLYNFIRMMAE